MIDLTLRSWRRVDANLINGQLCYGPSRQLRLFNLPRKRKLFAKPEFAYVKADRIQNQGLVLRALTVEEFEEHFLDKIYKALEPLAGQLRATLKDVTRGRPEFAHSHDRLKANTADCLYHFAEDLLRACTDDGCADPASAMYRFLLATRPADWYAKELNGVFVTGDYMLPDDYTSYSSSEMIQRIVIAHHYRVPLHSNWAQLMLAQLHKDGNYNQYHKFK